MVEVSNNFQTECEAYVGSYKFGKIKVNYIDDNPLNYEQGAYSSTNGTKIDETQSVRYNKLVECEPNFKYKIELGNSAIKMKIITYTEAQAFIAAHDNLVDGNELTTEATARYISVTIYSNDTLEGTAITLNNTIKNGEIAGVELKGNTTQNGTPTPSSPVEVNNVTGEQVVRVCGKNILPQDKYINDTTINGITYINNGDGTFSASGTATADTSIAIIPAGEIELEANQPYYLYSSIPYNANTFNLSIVMWENNATKYLTANNTYTPTTTPTQERLALWIPNGVSVNIQNAKIMLVRGTTRPTEYEKLQNKDYEINLGKNLYEGSQDFSGTWANSTSWSTAEETYNGLVVKYRQSAWNGLYKEIYVQKGDVYTFSFFAKKETSGRVTAYLTGSGVDATPQNKGFDITTEWQRYSFTFTITTSGKLRARVENPTNDSITYICGYQLEKNKTMTSYSPYFEPIELNKIGTYQDFIRKGTGKNLYVGYDNMLEGFLPQSGAYPTTNSSYPNAKYFTIYLKQGESITTSGITSNATGRIRFIDKTTNQVLGSVDIGQSNYYITTASYGDGFKNGTITAKKDIILGFMLITENEYGLGNFQIEMGSTATYYEPFGYKDKWYIEKNVGKVVLDGSESWSIFENVDGSNLFRIAFSNYVKNQLVYCNYYKGKQNQTGRTNFDIYTRYDISSLDILDNRYSTLADFKTWLQSNNTRVYYAFANPTYTLIDNEELLNQLEAVSHAETQEGITNIMTTGDLPAILDVMPDLTESIRGKQIKPYIGYNITSHDDLKNFKITGKADSNGKILGATPQTQIDIEIFNENNKHNLENKQIYVSTGLDETEGNYVEWQPFTITQAKDTQTKNHTNYTGYDDMMRNTTQYIDNIDYGEKGIPLYDYLCKVAKQIGMAVANDTIVNGDFIVRGNNFTNNEKILTVLSDIGKIADGFMMINRDNLLEVVDIAPIDDTREAIELTTNLYNEDFQNSPAFGPTNELAIGETNIETNAIVKSDEEAIAKDGVKKIEILDNYFLGELADKEEVANVLWEHLNGFSYYPYKTPYNGYPYIDLGDKLNITDINNNTYNSFIFNYVFEYNGGYKGNVGAEALSVTAAKYKTNNTLGKQFRKVGIEIDRVDGKITSEIDARDQADKDLVKAYTTAIEQSTGSISSRVEAVEKNLNGDGTAENPGVIEDIKTINKTMLTQDSSAFSAVVEQQDVNTSDIKEYNDDKNLQAIRKQIKFDINGVTMTAEGSTDADMKLHLSNKQIEFLYGNSPVLTINGNSIKFSSVSFEELGLGNYRWQDEADDSLSLYYKEEETT